MVADGRERAREQLNALLGSLPPRERKIIERRHLGDPDESPTLKEMGIELDGISRERVRQLEILALQKMRLRAAGMTD